MGDRCPICDREVATEHHEETLTEDEGTNLCWRAWDDRQCDAARVDWRARYLALSQEAASMREELVAVKEQHRRLVRGVVANAGRKSRRGTERWAIVMSRVGCGSTLATRMCVEAGFDPGEVVRGR